MAGQISLPIQGSFQLTRRMLHMIAVLAFGFAGQSATAQDKPIYGDVNAFLGVVTAESFLNSALHDATTEEEKAKLREKLVAVKERLPAELMKLADEFPGSTIGLAALYTAAFTKTNDQVADAAFMAFKEQATTSSLVQLADAVYLAFYHGEGNNLRIAETLLASVKKNPTHERAVELLTSICLISEADETESVPTVPFSEAAGLIAEHHAASPDISDFCERLEVYPAWSKDFEQHLERIQSINRHPDVHSMAALSLASIVEVTRPDDALRLYKRLLSEFDGNQEYDFHGRDKWKRDSVQESIARLEKAAIGKVAPDIVGVDLDGVPMKLSDYRGKVVLVSFWGAWCKPSVEFLSYEREITDTFKGKPFAIVGINDDKDIWTGKATAATHGVTWRSFRNSSENRPDISTSWGLVIFNWPMVYLIDVDGTIRNRWPVPVQKEVTESIEQLLDGQTSAK